MANSSHHRGGRGRQPLARVSNIGRTQGRTSSCHCTDGLVNGRWLIPVRRVVHGARGSVGTDEGGFSLRNNWASKNTCPHAGDQTKKWKEDGLTKEGIWEQTEPVVEVETQLGEWFFFSLSGRVSEGNKESARRTGWVGPCLA